MIMTAIKTVLGTVGTIVSWILNLLATVVEMVFAIPIAGRFLRFLLSCAYSLLYVIVSVPDTVLGSVGLRPQKQLIVCVIVQRDENGAPVADLSVVIRSVQFTIDVLKSQANIRVVPVTNLRSFSVCHSRQPVEESFVCVEDAPSSSVTLDFMGGKERIVWGDFSMPGSRLSWKMSSKCMWGSWRRLIGYGAPICAFGVRSFSDGIAGYSLAYLTDYVLLAFNYDRTATTLAHEIGHACNLGHVNDPLNLMHPNPTRGHKLRLWQVLLLRASRHVTYF